MAANSETGTKVTIYTDGSARGNPDGPGGYGTILHYEAENGRVYERELSAGYVKTTNNRMELMAAIAGLEALLRPCNVTLYTDSRYLSDAFNRHWIDSWTATDFVRKGAGPVKNIDLWKRLLKAMKPHNVSYVWVRGHNGFAPNERCDELAVKAALGTDLCIDPGVN